MKSHIPLKTITVSEIEGDFLVPSYQRGYRWGTKEVRLLLDDIYQLINPDKKQENSDAWLQAQTGHKNYCLQPIVVRRKGDSYELIDGQQRLTTIFLIYKYLSNWEKVFPNFPKHKPFSIRYAAREQSAEFLENINQKKDTDSSFDYIDFWYMSNAYNQISEWFNQDSMRSINMNHLLDQRVRIIWYEIGEEYSDEDVIALFARLNSGKIPLTSSELIKAVFLSRTSDSESDRRRQDEISMQWDNIERELHEDSLWYFLTNKATRSKYQTRIDLVLDLVVGTDITKVRDEYHTFFEFDKLLHENQPTNLTQREWQDKVWREEIEHTFLILRDWYEDHDLYHKIGYLIASETKTLQQIYEASKGLTKEKFNDSLDDFIRADISRNNYSELSYEDDSSKKKISTLLFLFNVESVRLLDNQSQRFPFDKFAESDGVWSLEHIHAQHSEGMKDQTAWAKWLSLHKNSVDAMRLREQQAGNLAKADELANLLDRMEKAEQEQSLSREEFDSIHADVVRWFSKEGSTEYMHSIANLALLDTSKNTVLSNATFDVKRNEIIQWDSEGKYIPFCTKMVFLKYYTSSQDNQLHFWGRADREAYVAAINDKLGKYLGEDNLIMLDKEDENE